MNFSKKKIKEILTEKLPGLNQDDIEIFLNISTYLKKDNKEIIIKSSTKSKKAFLILKGTIRGFIINNKGFENNVLMRSEGIFVGDSRRLFNDEPQNITFSTIEESHILLFNFKDFEALAKSNPNFLQLYINILKGAIVRLAYRVETLTTMTGEERYLDLIALNPRFLEKAHDKYVANYLGITPVSLSRIIKKLKAKDN